MTTIHQDWLCNNSVFEEQFLIIALLKLCELMMKNLRVKLLKLINMKYQNIDIDKM